MRAAANADFFPSMASSYLAEIKKMEREALEDLAGRPLK
jgi:hypothetical protein